MNPKKLPANVNPKVTIKDVDAVFQRTDIMERYKALKESELMVSSYKEMIEEVKSTAGNEYFNQLLEKDVVKESLDMVIKTEFVNKALEILITNSDNITFNEALVAAINEEEIESVMEILRVIVERMSQDFCDGTLVLEMLLEFMG